jgi:hypothetical protein
MGYPYPVHVLLDDGRDPHHEPTILSLSATYHTTLHSEL